MKIFYPDSSAVAPSLSRTHWMVDAKTTEPTQPPLTESITTDITIIGGGFVGLWTAIFAKQKQPDKRIVIVERDMCGGGASGRNGGFVMSWWSDILMLIELFGKSEALKLARLSEEAIDELENFCLAHQIDAHFQRGGWLWTATSLVHQGAWEETLRASEQLGASPYRRLCPEEVKKLSGSDRHLGGAIDPSNATIQPALLVAGLKRVALEMGVEIYESTPIIKLTNEMPAKLTTPNATIAAKKVILATNAWATAFPELRKYIASVSSTIIVTEPIPKQLYNLGFQQGIGVSDSYQTLGYYRTTADHRIVYGKSVAHLTMGDKITFAFSQSEKGKALATKYFYYAYPQLEKVRITDSWSAPIDYTNEHFPLFGHLKEAPHIIYGVGWSGNGVCPSLIGGKVLSSLALDLNNEWANSVLVGTINRGINQSFPSTLLRYFGGQTVRSAILWREQFEFKHRQAPAFLRWLAKLGGEIGT